jgi:Fic-DOC domain mobile mystery protein B
MTVDLGKGAPLPEPNDLPDGTTPLDPDEAEGLLPDHISTRGELNAWEQLNIVKGAEWMRDKVALQDILTQDTVRELHRRMFSETWTWAGRFRRSLKNIGVAPEAIPEHLYNLLADVTYWIEHQTYSVDEIGCRFHHRLVAIHPFPNGNGRHARIITDALLRALGGVPFSWGSGSIDNPGEVRQRYISSLRDADSQDYSALIRFVRS